MCTSPQTFYIADPAKNGGVRGLTKSPKRALFSAREASTVVVPCGLCIECRLAHAREWSLRCMHEYQTSSGGCFVTLTYDDEHLPSDNGLHHRDFQLFMHRLRNEFDDVRFFMCGEYGDDFGRPHYHAILYNVVFDDLVFLRKEGKVELFKSAKLSSIWQNGFVSVGAVSRHSAGYVARYSLKKIKGPTSGAAYQWLDVATGEIFDRAPPYSKASNRPGIGAFWFERFWRDVFPCDEIVFEGKRYPVPRYYQKLYERMNARGAEVIKREHRAHAKEMRVHPDNQPRRLYARQEFNALTSKNAKRNTFK